MPERWRRGYGQWHGPRSVSVPTRAALDSRLATTLVNLGETVKMTASKVTVCLLIPKSDLLALRSLLKSISRSSRFILISGIFESCVRQDMLFRL